MKHTPGPWRIDTLKRNDIDNTIAFTIVSDTAGEWVVEGEILTERDPANLALIAAAPELLETLEGCMKALARMIDKHDPDSIEAEWIGHAHEAIFKAKGE